MFELTKSSHGMDCIEVVDPTDDVRRFIRGCVLENRMDHPAYISKQSGMPFLQCDCDDYILVEFWGSNPKPFIDYLNENVPA